MSPCQNSAPKEHRTKEEKGTTTDCALQGSPTQFVTCNTVTIRENFQGFTKKCDLGAFACAGDAGAVKQSTWKACSNVG